MYRRCLEGLHCPFNLIKPLLKAKNKPFFAVANLADSQIKAWRACSIICVCVCVFVCARVCVCACMSPHGCVSKNKPLFAIANHVDSQQGPTRVNCLGTNQVQPGPTKSHHGQTEPTGANWSQLTPTDSNQGQPGVNRDKPGPTVPTGANRG